MRLTPSADRPTRTPQAGLGLGLACGVLTALLALAPAAQAKRQPDLTPPVFGGLSSATTCIPGPVGSGISTSYHLTWEAASDNKTKTKRIVYAVYQASEPGGENFSLPTYVTKHGAVAFDTPKLPSGQSYWFVVRARDHAGNEDANTVEREGVNLCV